LLIFSAPVVSGSILAHRSSLFTYRPVQISGARSPIYGARPLKRAIQQKIENPIARLVLEGRFGPKDLVPVDYREGQFRFERVVH
jgi:hypothetical protein